MLHLEELVKEEEIKLKASRKEEIKRAKIGIKEK